jgi:PilZ domain
MPSERRRAPRAQIALECTLRREHGSAITGRTLDVGTGGMSVATSRPLAEDELVRFDLALRDETHVDGRARVLRQQTYGVYALRFERLSGPPLDVLRKLVPGTP